MRRETLATELTPLLSVRTRNAIAHSLGVLAGAALLWVEIERYSATLASTGGTYGTATSTGAPKFAVRPEAEMRTAALRLFRAFLAELGLTPSSIGRVDRGAMPQTGDGLERYFR
jgi:Phage terminase, small subunit